MSGTLVLDCEGRFKLVRRTPELAEWLAATRAEDIRVITISVTLVEAREPVTNQARFDYAVSRFPTTLPQKKGACDTTYDCLPQGPRTSWAINSGDPFHPGGSRSCSRFLLLVRVLLTGKEILVGLNG
ncbi:hypothetical protein ABT071_35805 [Streptomyces sp. NPDC002506]|uniref:hypothetical protein n=1 Tax=Streptomyces sp. NPDC002506 TaxID=3154536 RepID=UPI0033193239